MKGKAYYIIVIALYNTILTNIADGLMFGFDQNHAHSKLASKAFKIEEDSLQKLKDFTSSKTTNYIKDVTFDSSSWEDDGSSRNQSPEDPIANPRIFYPTTNGADPSGGLDSTMALQLTIKQAFEVASTHSLMPGVVDLGGVEVHLGGGQYVISKPITLPDLGGGNIMIHGGTIRASSSFPSDGFLLELATTELREEWEKQGGKLTQSNALPAFENVVLQNLMLDCNYIAGGILLLNPLRTTISNCYITHFATLGISVQGGHETLIHSSFLGQHITSGGDPDEQSFSGTAIALAGNDNSVTDVIIFSAETAIEIDGQANIITGVHCYNKASVWGGTGILVRKGAFQTRMLGCYLDYTGIVLEESSQITISNSFFLGDAYILLKAMDTSPTSVFGVSIVDNMFYGNNKGIPIVQLQGNFSHIKQTYVDGNSAIGMALRSTRVRASTMGFGTKWTIDMSQTLLFPSSISHVHYSFYPSNILVDQNASTSETSSFPLHTLKSVTPSSITVVSNIPIHATISVYVDQSFYGDNDDAMSKPYF